MHDLTELAKSRQQEIFEKIIEAEGQFYIPPREMADHKNMLIHCNEFVMTAEFRDLEPKVQILIEKHIKDRVTLSQGGSVEAPAAAEAGAPMEPATAQGGLETPDMGAGQQMPAAPAAAPLPE